MRRQAGLAFLLAALAAGCPMPRVRYALRGGRVVFERPRQPQEDPRVKPGVVDTQPLEAIVWIPR